MTGEAVRAMTTVMAAEGTECRALELDVLFLSFPIALGCRTSIYLLAHLYLSLSQFSVSACRTRGLGDDASCLSCFEPANTHKARTRTHPRKNTASTRAKKKCRGVARSTKSATRLELTRHGKET